MGQNSIGVLRLILASMVVYSHSYYLGRFGPEPLLRWTGSTFLGLIAVQGFFCISGFLVAKSFVDNPSVVRYLWHRCLRLGPALWVCLGVTAFVFTPIVAEFSFADSLEYVARNALWPRAQLAIGAAPPTWNKDWNGSLWTLGYEFACYMMIAVAGVVGLLRRLKWAYGALVVAALAMLCVDIGFDLAPRIIHRLFDTPGKLLTWHFLAGSLFAVFPRLLDLLRQRPVVGLICLGLLVASWHGRPWLSPLAFPPAILWLAVYLPVYRFESKVGGDYSYGLYVYAYPVQQVLLVLGMDRLGLSAFMLCSLLIGLAFAVASWHLVEKRALRLKDVLASPKRPATSIH